MVRNRTLVKTGLMTAACALLAACGGSDPSTTELVTNATAAPPPPPPPPPTTGPDHSGLTADDFRTPEYERNYGLDAIGAADAYAAGYTGEGVIVGIFDYNFDFSSSELDFHPASRGRSDAIVDIYEAQIGDTATTSPHGQAVAVIAAGVRNEVGTHGVAFDAQVLAVDFFSGVNTSVEQSGDTTFRVSNPWFYLVDNGARVINKSLGYDEEDFIDNPPDVDVRYVVEWDANAVAAGALLVAAAGNDGDPDPMVSILDSIDILRDNDLLDQGAGALIVAGALGPDGTIADFSDRAGVAANYYLTAPGEDITVQWGDELRVGSGTSFAAPHITGAAALIFQRWPGLSAREVAEILFESADDLGAPGVDPIYGHGALNVAAALTPLGTVTVATATATTAGESGGTSGEGRNGTTATTVAGSAMLLGPAFGDAPGLGAALADVMILDGFGRDFQADLSGFVSAQVAQNRLDGVLDARRAWSNGQLGLGSAATLAISAATDPWALRLDSDGDARFGLAQLVEAPQVERVILGAEGHVFGFNWSTGTGLSLAEELGGIRGQTLSVTGADRAAIDLGRGGYATFGRDLGQGWSARAGIALGEHQGLDRHPALALREAAPTRSAAVQLSHGSETRRLSATFGMLDEEDALLGTRSAAGLAINGGATSQWLTIEAVQELSPRITARAGVTLAQADPGQANVGLLQARGRITATSFTAALGGWGLLNRSDQWSFSLHQPLRVEQAPFAIVNGAGFDADGALLLDENAVSLAPSGRELAVEAGYGRWLGFWRIDANLAFRQDAGHIAGLREGLALVTLNRLF